MTTADAFAPRLHRSADFPLARGAVSPELVQSQVALLPDTQRWLWGA